MACENPFDGLARYAIKEFEEGLTITLEEWANREGVSLDEEGVQDILSKGDWKMKGIADYKTSELVEELKNRLGVECMECNPYESYHLMANSVCDYGLILAYDESLGE
jgi:hypothetical protein